MKSSIKRTVEIFSSNLKLVYPPCAGGNKERLIQIIQPNELTQINMAMKIVGASNDGLHKARVHCVDVSTRELVYAWLFEIETEKPLV